MVEVPKEVKGGEENEETPFAIEHFPSRINNGTLTPSIQVAPVPYDFDMLILGMQI